MKTFKSYITESGVGPHALGYQMDNTINPAALANPVVVQRLNAYVGAVVSEQSKIVEDTMSNLRQKLMRVGLTFGQVPAFEGNSGSFSLPLSLFGGRFGKDENTPFEEFLDDSKKKTSAGGKLTCWKKIVTFLRVLLKINRHNCTFLRILLAIN